MSDQLPGEDNNVVGEDAVTTVVDVEEPSNRGRPRRTAAAKKPKLDAESGEEDAAAEPAAGSTATAAAVSRKPASVPKKRAPKATANVASKASDPAAAISGNANEEEVVVVGDEGDEPATAKKTATRSNKPIGAKKTAAAVAAAAAAAALVPPPPPPPPSSASAAVANTAATAGGGGDSEGEEEDYDEEVEIPYEERPGEFLVKSIIAELLIEFKSHPERNGTGEEEETLFLKEQISRRLRQDLDLECVALEKKKVEMSALMMHGITQMEITHGGAGVKSTTALFKLGDALLKSLEVTNQSLGGGGSNGHHLQPGVQLAAVAPTTSSTSGQGAVDAEVEEE
ncbi:hypothetical protein BASA81_004427 [Batrachochytrium salamandrivorans]|nr:hypothetical protein BASA81_004427 [Batrachochytrium salamandrivorans]